MKVFNKLILASSAIAITCVLSACGGSGGSTGGSTPASNKVHVNLVDADMK